MTNLLTLLKVYFRESFDKRKFKQDKHQQTFIAYLIIAVLLMLSSYYVRKLRLRDKSLFRETSQEVFVLGPLSGSLTPDRACVFTG